MVVSPGFEHSAAKARPGLMAVLDKLEPAQRPALVRGNCGLGNEPFMSSIGHVRSVAAQLPKANRWKTFVDYVVAKITRPLPPWLSPGTLAMAG